MKLLAVLLYHHGRNGINNMQLNIARIDIEIEKIKKAAELSGFKIYDENEYAYILNYQLNNNQFHFLEYDGKTIGFFGWLTKYSDDGICIFINNMFVINKYKKYFNIFDMCKFFKMKYTNICKLEWHSQKKDRFFELNLKGRKI